MKLLPWMDYTDALQTENTKAIKQTRQNPRTLFTSLHVYISLLSRRQYFFWSPNQYFTEWL